ncbi:hypothetical protein RFI_14218 [Reticulomyxa filosa]|uniref:ATPase AAA-type core domain-containing protein n=1 Tax=Reticulomyxa filosa TaxID=46433 RepID=X6N9K1_RETFI|nr:hypothetical protein RFI_14218 [Reticulomyxa filosa]|eukprot:ETO22965.1 hypothetical protein RFI_14218 [Reticulomyxa filosa]
MHDIATESKESKTIEESSGTEEFFLVKAWREADPPMVLLNQRQIQWDKPIEDDLKITSDQTLSLLAMNLDKNKHAHAKEWRLLRSIYHWDLHNFEEDVNKKEAMVQLQGVYHENQDDQFKKLRLLLDICGGFKSADPQVRQREVENLLKRHSNYALTFDNILKIVAIFFRIKAGIPVLIMGETLFFLKKKKKKKRVCGKTKLLEFMASALDINMTTIDVHGGYTVENLQQDLKQPSKEAREHPEKTQLVFLDEINTSPEIGAFKEVVCDHSLKGDEFPSNMVIIAALNPYRSRHQTEEEREEEKNEARNVPRHFLNTLEKEMAGLAYRVFPLPRSLQTYVWNFGSLAETDEQQYIAVMTTTTWSNENFTKAVTKKEISIEDVTTLKLVFIALISKSQKLVREILKDRSVCSLRDVRRANTLFLWFFKNRSEFNGSYCIVQAILLSLAHCYYYRLTHNNRIKYTALVDDHLAKSSLQESFAKVIETEKRRFISFFF